MKKLQMTQPKSITFGEGCELYLTNCKQRNLREGTIRHYRQSYLQFYKFFNEDMPELAVMAAGSLQGLAWGKSNGDKPQAGDSEAVYSFPVGKVNRLNVYPMNPYSTQGVSAKSASGALHGPECIQAVRPRCGASWRNERSRS